MFLCAHSWWIIASFAFNFIGWDMKISKTMFFWENSLESLPCISLVQLKEHSTTDWEA